MSCSQPAGFVQAMVDQRPKFDNRKTVGYSKRSKVIRPTKKKKKIKWL